MLTDETLAKNDRGRWALPGVVKNLRLKKWGPPIKKSETPQEFLQFFLKMWDYSDFFTIKKKCDVPHFFTPQIFLKYQLITLKIYRTYTKMHFDPPSNNPPGGGIVCKSADSI